ncbi:hypothetical protein D3C87_2072420 [compost metagenome]
MVSDQPALPEVLAEWAGADCELAESALVELAATEAARAFTAASKNFFTPSHDSWSARALSFGFPPLVLILPDTGWA